MAKQQKILAVTPAGVFAFAWIVKPDTGHKYSDNKYKITLVLPGSTDMSAIRAKALAAAKQEFPDVSPEDITLPFKSGDDHKNDEFHGKVLLTAKSKFQPQVVDSKRKELPEGVQVRSGDEGKLVINLYPYTKTEKVKEGKRVVDVQTWGVSAQLNVVQLLKKNAGGGGMDLLADEEGFDGDSYEGPRSSADQTEADEAVDNGDY
jgi:hypothetical protein